MTNDIRITAPPLEEERDLLWSRQDIWSFTANFVVVRQ